MKLQEKLPRGVWVNGKFVKCDFDFRNVLDMNEILARDDLLPEARVYKALRCVAKRVRMPAETLSAIQAVLFPATKKSADKAKITDFTQDADLIRAAFLQVYGIDLYTEKLHWLKFSSLLAGLPEGNRYCDVLGIRARPMPAPTKWNAEERKWLAKAKADLAVRMTEQEREVSLEKSLRGVALSLLALAEKGGGNNG